VGAAASRGEEPLGAAALFWFHGKAADFVDGLWYKLISLQGDWHIGEVIKCVVMQRSQRTKIQEYLIAWQSVPPINQERSA
jgi:hypothetical protein